MNLKPSEESGGACERPPTRQPVSSQPVISGSRRRAGNHHVKLVGVGGVGLGEGGAATVDDAQAVFIYALCCCYSSSCDFRRSSLKAQRWHLVTPSGRNVGLQPVFTGSTLRDLILVLKPDDH